MTNAIQLVREDAEAVLAGREKELRELQGKHLFITGGTGFLGAWLLELIKVLNERHNFGISVTVFSRRAKEFALQWPHLGRNPWLTLQEGDIRHFAELPRDVSYIIHAASLTDRRHFASQPTAVAETIGLGTIRLLRAANLLDDVKKIVLMSSGLIYGKQDWELGAVDEKHIGSLACHDVNSVYAESKRYAEVVAQCSISESKLPIVTLRPFAFVGPYQSIQLPWAVTDFIRDSFNGGPIRIMGDGSTVRSIMYGSDFAYWVLCAMANAEARSIYNVGSPEPIDLGSLAKLITQNFTPSPQIITHVGKGNFERSRLVPSISKATNELGLKVTVPLREAITRAIRWNQYTKHNES